MKERSDKYNCWNLTDILGSLCAKCQTNIYEAIKVGIDVYLKV